MAMEQEQLDKVRASIMYQVGSRVQIMLDEGRHRTDIREGVLKDAYPSVFTVLVEGKGDSQQLMSFSYSDIVTRGVRMRLC